MVKEIKTEATEPDKTEKKFKIINHYYRLSSLFQVDAEAVPLIKKHNPNVRVYIQLP